MDVSSGVQYAKYIFPHSEHKPLISNKVAFIQNFTHEHLISNISCHEKATSKFETKLVLIRKLKTLLVKVKVSEKVTDKYLKFIELIENC